MKTPRFAFLSLLVLTACGHDLPRPPEFQPERASDRGAAAGLVQGLGLQPRGGTEEDELQAMLEEAEKTAGPEGRRIIQTGRSMIDQGAIVVGSCWDYINAVYKRAGFQGKNIATPFAGKQKGPFASADLIQPGDWLYFINHNYGDIEHSGIFIGWEDREAKIALILSYRGENSRVPGRYSTYELTNVYNIMRGKPGLAKTLPPIPPEPQVAFRNPTTLGVQPYNEYSGVMASSSGLIYLTNTGRGWIEVYDATGKYLSQMRVPAPEGYVQGEDEQAFKAFPEGIAVSSSFLYVLDAATSDLLTFDVSGKYLSRFHLALSSTENDAFEHLARDAQGNFYVVETIQEEIRKYGPDGKFLFKFGGKGTGPGQFASANGIVVNTEGQVFVADTGNHRIQKFSSAGAFLGEFGTAGTGESVLTDPIGLALDSSGKLYVGDGNRVAQFDANGNYLSQIPAPGHVWGVSVAADGSVYVTQDLKGRVRKIR